jgi:hypothetical protein
MPKAVRNKSVKHRKKRLAKKKRMNKVKNKRAGKKKR